MVSFTSTRCHQKHRPARLSLTIATTKPNAKPSKHGLPLTSLEKHFWYSCSDGVARLATSCDNPNVVPQQVNSYCFNKLLFAREPYPSSFPAGGRWPPRQLSDLLCPSGPAGGDCVGDECYTNVRCRDQSCTHTLEKWEQSTTDWQTHFELRKTDERGVGVFTRRAFRKGDILGWYAGELKPLSEAEENDYLMEMEIGRLPVLNPRGRPSETETETTVIIDASRKGNWTRFINHSCEPYAVFRIRRVGAVRVMVVEAVRSIPADEELSVGYGTGYYGVDTVKICCCGVKTCVGEKRRREQERKEAVRRPRVKRCKRLTVP